jgi:DNA-binding CsgD family transcriptional regulator
LLAEAPYPVLGIERLGAVVWANSAAIDAFHAHGPLVGKRLLGPARGALLPAGASNLKAWLAGRLYPITAAALSDNAGAPDTFLSVPFRAPPDSGAALAVLLIRIGDSRDAAHSEGEPGAQAIDSRPFPTHATHTRTDALAALTSRERQIVIQLLDGSRTTLIAEEFRISVNTVRNHLKSIFRKLGVNSQAQLVRVLRQPRA